MGVRGGLLTLVPFRNTTLLYHAKWQSQTTQDDFSRFFRLAVGRPLADLVLVGTAAKKSPRHRQTFAGTPTAGGELRRGYRRLTTPPCVLKHHAPWRCGAHITYIISSLCQANANGNRGVPRRVPDIIMAFRIGLEVSVQGGFFPPPDGLVESLYFIKNILMHHRLLCSEKRFILYQKYANES